MTGRVEEKPPNPMEGMTEEQKEHEAMKLVNMFDKLSRYVACQGGPRAGTEEDNPCPVMQAKEVGSEWGLGSGKTALLMLEILCLGESSLAKG